MDVDGLQNRGSGRFGLMQDIYCFYRNAPDGAGGYWRHLYPEHKHKVVIPCFKK